MDFRAELRISEPVMGDLSQRRSYQHVVVSDQNSATLPEESEMEVFLTFHGIKGSSLPRSFSAYYRRACLSIFIPPSIEKLENEFRGNTSLRVVRFPLNSKLHSLGEKAFADCSSLEFIELPPSLKLISRLCFQNCSSMRICFFHRESQLATISLYAFANTGLERIEIPSKVSILGEYCFMDNKHLAEVWFDEDCQVEKISYKAFCNCKSLRKVHLSRNVEVIENRAFNSCPELQEIEVPVNSKLRETMRLVCEFSGVKSFTITPELLVIGNYVFRGCKRLVGINLAGKPNLVRLNIGSFQQCSSLISICIPSSVKEIENYVFQECTALKIVTFAEGSQLKRIGSCAFSRTPLRNVELPESLVEPTTAFSDCKDLLTVRFKGDSTNSPLIIDRYIFHGSSRVSVVITKPVSVLNCVAVYDEGKVVRYFQFGEQQNTETQRERIIIPKCVEVIGEKCFENCNDIEVIEFEEHSRLVSLDKGSLSFLKKLREIKLTSENLSSIRSNVFGEGQTFCCVKSHNGNDVWTCGSVKIYVPGRWRMFDGELQRVCDRPLNWFSAVRLEPMSLTIPANVTQITIRMFLYCQNLRDVRCEQNSELTVIGCEAFAESSIKTFECPGKLTAIHDCAFRKSSLKSITLSNSVTTIGRECFSCSALTEIHIPDNVEVIQEQAFYNCAKLKTATFGEKSRLTSIQERVFALTALEEITIPDNWDSVSAGCFAMCWHLRKAVIGAGVKQIENRAFMQCRNLEVVSFEKCTQLIYLGIYSFSDTKLKNVTIPETVDEIDSGCFSGCYLENVTFAATYDKPVDFHGGCFGVCYIKNFDLGKVHIKKGTNDRTFNGFFVNLSFLAYSSVNYMRLSHCDDDIVGWIFDGMTHVRRIEFENPSKNATEYLGSLGYMKPKKLFILKNPDAIQKTRKMDMRAFGKIIPGMYAYAFRKLTHIILSYQAQQIRGRGWFYNCPFIHNLTQSESDSLKLEEEKRNTRQHEMFCAFHYFWRMRVPVTGNRSMLEKSKYITLWRNNFKTRHANLSVFQQMTTDAEQVYSDLWADLETQSRQTTK